MESDSSLNSSGMDSRPIPGSAHKNGLEESLIWLAAENCMLKRALQDQSSNSQSLRARLQVSNRCLKILHSQRPAREDVFATRFTEKLMLQLDTLCHLDADLQDRMILSEEELPNLHRELVSLRMDYAQVLEISQKVKMAYEKFIAESQAENDVLLSRCQKAESSLEIEKTQKRGYCAELEALSQNFLNLQNSKDNELAQEEEIRLAHENTLASLKEDLNRTKDQLQRAIAVSSKLREGQMNKDHQLKKLMLLAQTLEQKLVQSVTMQEKLDEESVTLRVEAERLRASLHEKDNIIVLLDRQCMSYEATLQHVKGSSNEKPAANQALYSTKHRRRESGYGSYLKPSHGERLPTAMRAGLLPSNTSTARISSGTANSEERQNRRNYINIAPSAEQVVNPRNCHGDCDSEVSKCATSSGHRRPLQVLNRGQPTTQPGNSRHTLDHDDPGKGKDIAAKPLRYEPSPKMDCSPGCRDPNALRAGSAESTNTAAAPATTTFPIQLEGVPISAGARRAFRATALGMTAIRASAAGGRMLVKAEEQDRCSE